MKRVYFNTQLLWCGDCLDLMSRILDKSVNLILVDLPYGTTACKWDVIIPFQPLWKEFKRILVDDGAVVLTAVQPFTSMVVASNLGWFKYCWVWEKASSGGFFNAKFRPLKGHEDICVFSPAVITNCDRVKMKYNPQGVKSCNIVVKNTYNPKTGIYGQRPSRSKGKEFVQTQTGYPKSVLKFPNYYNPHQTGKPPELFEYLIRTYTNPGDLVLDCCMGSGTTGISAINSNRRFIGIEKDEEIFALAEKRLNTFEATGVFQGREKPVTGFWKV